MARQGRGLNAFLVRELTNMRSVLLLLLLLLSEAMESFFAELGRDGIGQLSLEVGSWYLEVIRSARLFLPRTKSAWRKVSI